MRRTGWGTRTVRPVSSMTRGNGGRGGVIGETDCGRNGTAQESVTAMAAQAAVRSGDLQLFQKISPKG